LIVLERFIHNIGDFGYPFALNVDFFVMSFHCIKIRGVQQAETNTGLFVVEQVDMSNSEFVRWRLAELS
jgi:hypothetical protein